MLDSRLASRVNPGNDVVEQNSANAFQPFVSSHPGRRASLPRETGLANHAAVVFILAAHEIAEFRPAYTRRVEPLEKELRFQLGRAERCRKHRGEPRLRFVRCFARCKYPKPDLDMDAWET